MTDGADEATVRNAQAGDHEAFRKLLRLHQDAVYDYCLRLLGDAAEAQDAAQEAFVRCYERLRSLDHPTAFRYWLYAIVRNEVFGRLRRRRQYQIIPLDEAEANVWEETTPFEHVVDLERRALLARLLNRLRPEYREVVILREVDGMSYEEIAAVTGATLPAVKARLFKARRALANAATEGPQS